MKFRTLNKEHAKEILECLFNLGFVWSGCRERKIQFTESAYLFAYWESKSITKSELVDGSYFKNHNSVETTLEELKQMLNQTKKKPHKHAELIKAWADGAEIQYQHRGEWYDVHGNSPTWESHTNYRIKPEPSDIEKYGIEVGDVWYVPYFKKFHTIRFVNTNASYSGGKVITTLGETKISYGMFIEDKSELVFRRGVIDRLNEL
ncbi:MAG: hypothetical protein ACKO8L_12260 [Flavobacterium sp.]